MKEYSKQYAKKHSIALKKYKSEWGKSEKREEYKKSSRRIKQNKIHSWKQQGIQCNFEWDEVYEWYSNTTNCDICSKLFVVSMDMCLDHDHELQGYNIRGILCQRCNNWSNEL